MCFVCFMCVLITFMHSENSGLLFSAAAAAKEEVTMASFISKFAGGSLGGSQVQVGG